MALCPCEHFDPWKKTTIVNICECYHYIPLSGRCDCPLATDYMNPCPWEGYPKGELTAWLTAYSK